jgi:hypothetical protein
MARRLSLKSLLFHYFALIQSENLKKCDRSQQIIEEIWHRR